MCVLVNWVLLSVIVIDAAFATTASPDLGHAFTVECDHFCSCDHNDVESQDFIPFFHETCEVRNLTGLDYKPCYKIPGYFDHEGKVKVFVKFKGDSDGHVRLEDDSGHGYEIVFGSWHNMHSEIRTIHDDETQDRMKVLLQTPRILSPDEFKSFYVEYDKSEAKLETFEGGRASKLVSWVDKESFDLRYVSFSGFHSDKTIQVAFNCTATDNRSTIYLLDEGSSSSSEGSIKNVAQDIRTKILEDYHTAVHPPTTENNPVVVKLGMSVRHFNLDESESTFYVNCWLNLQWNDSRLTWSLNETNKKDLRFTDAEIWRPDVTLYNNAYPTEVDHYGSTLLVVNSNGRVYWVPPARLAAHCRMNLIRWPYDSHTCEFKIGSWTHDGFTVDLQLELADGSDEENYKIDFSGLDQFIENSEWTVTNSGAKRNAVYYSCCPEPYVDITFSFTIQRNSPSYVVCVILPISIIALVNIFVFLLPPTSGEKITLASINFFIICMYLIYFEAKLPSMGDHLPLLVLLYACNLVLVGISLVISVIVLNLARVRRPSRPPQCLRLFCNINFAQVLGLGHIVPYVSSTHSRLDDGVEMQPARGSSRNGLDGHFEKDDQDITLIENEVPYMNNAEWILLASMIDRISFIVYAVVSGIILGLCLA